MLLNIGLIALGVFFIYKGYRNGLFKELSILTSLLGAFFITNTLFDNILQFSLGKFNLWVALLLVILCFLVSFIAVKFIIKRLIWVNDLPLIGIVSRLLGSVVSILKYFIILLLITFLLHTPFIDDGSRIINDSTLLQKSNEFLMNNGYFNNLIQTTDQFNELYQKYQEGVMSDE